jgi:hypothetical protein
MLAELIERGELPRPRHSIRVITTEECLGMLAFATENEALSARALVGMNVDGAGAASEANHPFRVHYGPLSAPTFAWAAAGALGARCAARAGGNYHLCSQHAPPESDDMIADPNFGVPTLWLGTNGDVTGYHSSADTPGRCAEVSLRTNALLVAAWAYAMADLNADWAVALLPDVVRWIDDQLLGEHAGDALALRRWAAGRALRDLSRWSVPTEVYEPPARPYAPPAAEPLADLPAAGPVYARKTWGTCTLELLPPASREGLSRWNHWQNAALFWTFGGRPLAAVERLTRAEIGDTPEGGVARLLEACCEARLAVRTDR